jgi:hypothetical protein
VALVLAFLVGTVVPAAAQSSSDTGIIQITVKDVGADKTLADARVFLLGPTVASALTNKTGIVKYTDVPSGIYRVRVSKAGFAGVTSRAFEVLGEKEVDVNVDLGVQVASRPTQQSSSSTDSSGLKVIGSTKARVTVQTTDVDQNSAVRRISDSLTDALSSIGGVDVTQDTNDPNAPQTISLRGHDESQTAITLDGIPLSAPGSAANLRNINTDLFGGASVSFGAQAGSLGGSVNFRTLQPTQTWQTQGQAADGSFDRYNYSLGETGSIGKLGIAVLTTKRAGNNPLTFQDYTDESGLTYPHGGETANIGDFVKLRYELTDSTTLLFTALQNNQATNSLCTQDVTPLPCGIGPDNGSTAKFNFEYATVQTLIGQTALSVTGYINNNQSFTNDLNRYIAPVAPDGTVGTPVLSPLASVNDSLARGIAASATLTRDKQTFTLTGSTFASTTTFDPLVESSAFVLPSTNAIASRSVQFADSIKINDKLSIGPTASYAGTSGAGSSILGGLSGTWRPNVNDTYTASLSVGSSQPAAGIVRSYSDPDSARINCGADTAQVSGPGDQPGPQSAVSYDFGYTHAFEHGQVSIDTYRQTQSNQLVGASLTADSLGLTDPANPFNPYLQQVYTYFGNVCNAGAPSTPQVYVQQQIGGTNRLYQGFTINGRYGIGKNFVIIPSYTVAQSEYTAANPFDLGYDSTLILNEQIPGRPLHTGNVTIDAFQPQSKLEFLANARYVGTNNNQHISPYVIVNAGISRVLGIGQLTFFASNLFNTETGFFSTEQYAVPIPLSGGGSLLQAANPNAPRSYTLSYSFNTGARPGAGYSSGSRLAKINGASASPSPAPNRGLGFGQLKFTPPPDGVDPLTVAASREECTADLKPVATAILASIGEAARAYVAGTPLPTIKGITLTPHGDAKGVWWFALSPDIPANAFRRPEGNAGGGGGGGRRGGGGGPGGPGGPGGEGGPGGPGGPPGGFEPNISASSSDTAPRVRQTPSPELIAAIQPFRALVSCSYGTVYTQAEAKEKGYDVPLPGIRGGPGPAASPSPSPAARPRPAPGGGIYYATSPGIFVVRAPELGSGGGSVKQ